MAEALIEWVARLDRCWLEGRFDDLAGFLAEGVLFVGPGGSPRLKGADVAIDSYRQFMQASRIERYSASNHQVTRHADAAVVEYEWDMAWTSGGEAHVARGREVLALAQSGGEWRLFWRSQLPA